MIEVISLEWVPIIKFMLVLRKSGPNFTNFDRLYHYIRNPIPHQPLQKKPHILWNFLKMASFNAVVVCALLVLCMFVPSLATVYTVGDTSGWAIGPDYSTWTSGKTFAVGDSLGKFSLFLPPSDEYCNFLTYQNTFTTKNFIISMNNEKFFSEYA